MDNDPKNTDSENNREDKFVDEKTKERIQQHISDRNSKISDEDIQNVNTDIFKREGEDIKGLDEEIAKKAPNPWDIKS